MKNVTKLTAILLLVVMAGLIAISGTYAKYTTTASGADTAVVAKFAVGGITEDTFNLFDESVVYEIDATTEDADVAPGKIAPGTGGKCDIVLTNDSDVSVSYALTIKETSNTSSIPLVYSINGTDYYSLNELATLEPETTGFSGELDVGSTTQKTETVTLYWKWAFDGDDTSIGTYTDTAPEVEVTASVVFTQVD